MNIRFLVKSAAVIVILISALVFMTAQLLLILFLFFAICSCVIQARVIGLDKSNHVAGILLICVSVAVRLLLAAIVLGVVVFAWTEERVPGFRFIEGVYAFSAAVYVIVKSKSAMQGLSWRCGQIVLFVIAILMIGDIIIEFYDGPIVGDYFSSRLFMSAAVFLAVEIFLLKCCWILQETDLQ